MSTTERLISTLAGNLTPIRRLRPPALRWAVWLGGVGLCGAVAVAALSTPQSMAIFERRATDPKLAIELAGTLLTGLLAALAAFELSLPDRSARWTLLPLPSLLLWVGSSGYSCWRHWIMFGPEGWEVGESAACFVSIVAFSAPLAIALMLMLRRARPLAPGRVAFMGGLAVAALGAFMLQFFHPFDVTFMDLGLHLAAVAVVILCVRAFARPALGRL